MQNIHHPTMTAVFDSTASNNDPTIILTVGLPGAGKTTWAEVFAKAWKFDIICRDDFRYNDPRWIPGKFVKALEKDARRWRDSKIVAAVLEGKDTVVADTNLDVDGRIENIHRIIREAKIERGYKIVLADFRHVPLDTVIEQDAKRERPIGRHNIVDLWAKHVRPETMEMPSKGKTLIVDLDGTLAHKHDGRTHYDNEGFLDDHVDPYVQAFVHAMYNTFNDLNVVICTGRALSQQGRDETLVWLERHGIRWQHFMCREVDDNRPDQIVKREMYDKLKEYGYNPCMAIDDRPKVCRMWESLGLKVFKVGPYCEF